MDSPTEHRKILGILDTRLAWFFLLIGSAAYTTYFAPKFVNTAFFVLVLIAYFRSKDEPFWLAYFLILSDGFLGFFDNYEVVLAIIPGLPGVEVAHFYIILATIKAWQSGSTNRPFYAPVMQILLIYLLFLVVQGYVIGLNPALNVQFRLIKFILPLLMFYAVPRLFTTSQHYQDTFRYILPLALTSLFAQLFTIATSVTPAQYLGVQKEVWFAVDVTKGKTFRGFFSPACVLMAFFGSMYYLSEKSRQFRPAYLVLVLSASAIAAYLSATRGWVIAFTVTIFLFLAVVYHLSAKRILQSVAGISLLVVGLMYIPAVNIQITNAFERLTTLEALARGDVSAGGTLQRLDQRSPVVMGKWAESPLTGWGFSDVFFKYADFHVGNQNVLMHAGIVGAFLLVFFFAFVFLKLWARSRILPSTHPVKDALLVFPVFFLGMLVIHSTSGQQFMYYQDPDGAIALSLFFGLAALAYRDTMTKPVYEQH